VHRRVGSQGVDLEVGQKALPGDAHLVPAFDRPFDLPFDRKTRLERVFELPRGCGAARSFRERISPQAVDITMA
jgi:hypothetical protein